MQNIWFQIFAKCFEDKRPAHARADPVVVEMCSGGPV